MSAPLHISLVVLELCDGMALAWPTRPTSGDGQLQDAIIRFGGISYSVIDDQEKHAERSDSPLPLADDDALPRLLGLGAAARAAAPGAADMKGAPQPKLCKTQTASLLQCFHATNTT